ncbi:MAG: GTP 3',8-cyclase MoaA [Pigmentiphaga sp.]|nr:GTP 3',8-cyclase MoaA [Pigmentiphaga sp.]
MTDKVVPVIDLRNSPRLPVPDPSRLPTGSLQDQRGRALHDLRISVTDRCNFRCVYCMPKEVFDKDYQYLPHASLLSFEEIVRLTRLFVAHGTEKIRLTGGEPLLRKHIEKLIEQLAELRTPSGKPLDLTLTTNGSILAKKAPALKAAGLNRVTVSLDALDDALFKRMNDMDFPVSDVLKGIDAAAQAGLGPIKVNMVVKKGVNDHQILPMAEHFRYSGHILRFIEYMDVGASNDWKMDEVLPSADVLERIHQVWPIEPLDPHYTGEVAQRWRYRDGAGEVGVISSVTQAFCGTCTRARLSTEGQLYLCLFAQQGWDLRQLLRGGGSDAEISDVIAQIWGQRNDHYSEIRTTNTPRSGRVEMSYIGG